VQGCRKTVTRVLELGGERDAMVPNQNGVSRGVSEWHCPRDKFCNPARLLAPNQSEFSGLTRTQKKTAWPPLCYKPRPWARSG